MPMVLVPGIYAPTQVIFHKKTEDLDNDAIARHAVRLARAGIVGIVTNGSNGEAAYLSPQERSVVTAVTRRALDAAGFSHVPVISGASDESVRGTVQLCRDAEAVGADAVLILVPSFFKWAMNTPTIETYFTQVADQSPLPVIIYNYPGAVAGIDLDSELLIRLIKHPKIIGTKFTCGNVGKLARVAAETAPVCEGIAGSRQLKSNVQASFAFAGIADFILPSVTVGASGAIVGAANVFPRACVRVYDLALSGRAEEARAAQMALATADWSLTKRAIPGFKALLQRMHGYGGLPKQPMQALSEEGIEELVKDVKEMIEIENGLGDKIEPKIIEGVKCA